jgi:hypothetical protein
LFLLTKRKINYVFVCDTNDHDVDQINLRTQGRWTLRCWPRASE